MKKDHLILIIFLAIIVISGGVVYVMKSSSPLDSPQSQNTSADPNLNTELKSRIATLEARLPGDPNNLSILIDLGNAYYDIGEPARSVEYYERSLVIQPNNPHVLVDCGAMYRELGQPLKAIELFDKAIAIDSQFPQAYFNKGATLRMDLGDQVGAARAWKKYLSLENNVDPELRDLLNKEIAAVADSQ